jgi:hypothetical protein
MGIKMGLILEISGPDGVHLWPKVVAMSFLLLCGFTFRSRKVLLSLGPSLGPSW